MTWNVHEYEELTAEKFDAVVSGELVHQALHCEQELIEIITDHFCRDERRGDFRRLLLHREGLSFQDKIEIVRAMLPELRPDSASAELKPALAQIEELKSLRNAFAHGLDSVGVPDSGLALSVEIVTRSGKEKEITVTPASHCKKMEQCDELTAKLRAIRKVLIQTSISSVTAPEPSEDLA